MSNSPPLYSSVDPLTRAVRVEDVGAADGLDPHACSALALDLLQAAAGDDHVLASLTLNLGSVPAAASGGALAEAWVDRRTRTLTFCQMRVMANGELLFAARGLLSRRA